MTMTLKLTPSDREFFNKVAQAAFTNPFSQARVELDRSIAGRTASASWDVLVEQAVAKSVSASIGSDPAAKPICTL